MEAAWNPHGGAVFCTQVSFLPPISPHPTIYICECSGWIWEPGLSAQWCKSKRVPGQGRAESTQKPGSPSQSDSPPRTLKGGRASMAQSPSTAGKWPENLIGRNLIETVRKVKAEELTTPTGPEKGQCELSSCSIWCQRPWLLSSTARQFRPPWSAPPRKANSSALKGDLLVSSRVLFLVAKSVS